MSFIRTQPTVTLVSITPDAENLIALAARTCTNTEDRLGDSERTNRLIRDLVCKDHSVLEFADATFKIVCDRGTANEITRHRIGSYAQQSQRYVRAKEAIGYAIPDKLTDEQEDIINDLYDAAMVAYEELLAADATPEKARVVLPIGWETVLLCKWNFREIRHIIKLRGAPGAHPFFREIVRQIVKIMQREAPMIFGERQDD